MTKRKYMGEFGLNMINGYTTLTQQEHLDQFDQTGIEPHIYFVTRRPRISLDPESVKFTDDEVTGNFQKQIKDKLVTIPFRAQNHLGTSKISLNCEYPFTEYEMVDKNGRCPKLS